VTDLRKTALQESSCLLKSFQLGKNRLTKASLQILCGQGPISILSNIHQGLALTSILTNIRPSSCGKNERRVGRTVRRCGYGGPASSNLSMSCGKGERWEWGSVRSLGWTERYGISDSAGRYLTHQLYLGVNGRSSRSDLTKNLSW
jgi:hypothetical protein